MTKEIMDILQDYKQNIPDDPSVNILDNGIIDSFDIVNIVVALESHFHISVEAEDILPENFQSIDAIANMMSRYDRN